MKVCFLFLLYAVQHLVLYYKYFTNFLTYYEYMKWLFGPLLIAFGVLLVIKTEWFVENLGHNAWAEEHLGGSGGTRLMYKLSGILLIFGTMMWVTGMLGPLVMSTIGSLFGLEAR